MNKQSKKSISETLKELRISHNLKQIDVAVAAEVKQSTYSQYETGKRIPSTLVLYRIASYYGISVDDLLKLCIDLDDDIYFDAITPSSKGKEQTDYLKFSRQKRYASLGKREKELLFHFSGLNAADQEDVIDYAAFKKQKPHIK